MDRFLASFAQDKKVQAAFDDWVNRMQTLDQESRTFEVSNLSLAGASGSGAANDADRLLKQVIACGDLLKNADYPDLRDRLSQSVTAPDDYIRLRRFAGLYPLTRLFISAGVSNWHAEARRTFSNTPPSGWQVERYLPSSIQAPAPIEQILPTARRDALGIPDFAAADLQALFHAYAPIWEIQQKGPADRIGKPHWGADGRVGVDTGKPVTYTLLSFTRFEDRVLTQLNYFIWFPERPKQHPLDILGGWLDGLIYRVTLDDDGTPLLYETVHSCGCYYKAFPTHRLEPAAQTPYAEPPLILSAPRLRPAQEVMTLSMESRTHYVRHLYTQKRSQLTGDGQYAFAAYDQLRSLATSSGGFQSMFGEDGIAPGSERLERFILWPTGVLSPGAMRQWGRHAVAFAGKRHFDDPFYMDHMFERK